MKIMLAYDGSVEAHAAGAWLEDLSIEENALEVLTVVRHQLHHRGLGTKDTPLLVGSEDSAVWKSAKMLAGRLAPTFTEVRTSLRTGDPVEEILDEARCSGAELIVLGHRHRPPLAEKLPGSVARGVLERASCSVLLVRAGSPAPRRVLLAHDRSPAAHAALQTLLRLPLGDRLHVEVISIAEPVPPPVAMVDPNGMTYMAPAVIEAMKAEMDQRGQEAAEAAAYAVRQLERKGWAVSQTTPSGEPACEILNAAATGGADLIVLGGHTPLAWMEGTPGNTAAEVVQRARCSVLVGRVQDYGLRQRMGIEDPS